MADGGLRMVHEGQCNKVYAINAGAIREYRVVPIIIIKLTSQCNQKHCFRLSARSECRGFDYPLRAVAQLQDHGLFRKNSNWKM